MQFDLSMSDRSAVHAMQAFTGESGWRTVSNSPKKFMENDFFQQIYMIK
jgi:hypothetical protein